jgi:hypothetical protein
MDQLASGDLPVKLLAEPLLQVTGVPDRPLRIRTIGLDEGLVVGLARLPKQIGYPGS